MNINELERGMKRLFVETDKRRRYRAKHKQAYKKWRDTRRTCAVCGGKHTNTNKSKHIKTAKHCRAVKKNEKA